MKLKVYHNTYCMSNSKGTPTSSYRKTFSLVIHDRSIVTSFLSTFFFKSG